jgi:D-xylonolactonase
MQPEAIVDRGCSMGECPRWDADAQLLYWCDMLGGAVFRYDPNADEVEQIYDGPNVGGFLQYRDGSLCLFLEDGTVKRWEDGDVTTVQEGVPGSDGVRFHDVIADPEGRILCGTLPTDDAPSRLYRFDPDGTFTPLVTDVAIANGLGFSSGYDRFYLVDTERDRIDAFDYDAGTGTLSGRKPFVETTSKAGTPDGLVVDAADHVWVPQMGGGQVLRYRPDGSISARVSLPVPTVTSIEFGGPERRTAYVTTGTDDEAETAAKLAGALFRFETDATGRDRDRAALPS